MRETIGVEAGYRVGLKTVGERRRARVAVAALCVLLMSSLGASDGCNPEHPHTIGPVGPAAEVGAVSGPLDDLTGDCGFSTPLRDGNVFWMFCDPGFGLPVVHNTAQLAPASDPTITQPASTGGQPYEFLDHTWASICPAGDDVWIWPLSAITVPDGAEDRVLVYYEEVCARQVGDSWDITSIRIGLAEWRYTPGVTPLTAPIVGTVLQHDLWRPDQSVDYAGFARAALHVPDPDPAEDFVYVYYCNSRWDGPTPWGCHAGRVRTADVAVPSAYRYWVDGRGFSETDPKAADDLVLQGADVPGIGIHVGFYPDLDLFGLTYMEWIGINQRVKFRVAVRPEGPWSFPTTFDVADTCGVEPKCYAAYGHPELSSGDEVAITYYDQDRDDGGPSSRGAVFWRTIPVEFHAFGDVPPGSSFFTEIEWLNDMKIQPRTSEGTYRPTEATTRAEEALLLYEMARVRGHASIPFTKPETATFSDVPTDHEHFEAIEWKASVGLASGTTFGPDVVEQRGASATSLYAFSALTGDPSVPFTPPATPTFADVPTSHPRFVEIEWMWARGLTQGFSDGTYRPDADTSRQAIAAFLYRMEN